MTLIDRIMRLFRADIHDLLDRIEEPAVVLKQAVRDMEQELGLEQLALEQMRRDSERLGAQQKEIDAALGGIESQLDVCFASDNLDLVRRLIKRRLELEALNKQLSRKHTQLQGSRHHRLARFEENQARLTEIRQKSELFVDHGDIENPPEEREFNADGLVRDEDVEVAFLKEKQKRSRV